MAESQWHPSEAVTGWSLNGQTWTIMRRADGVPALEGTTGCPSLYLVCWLFLMSAAMVALPVAAWLISADWLATGYLGLVCGVLCAALLWTAVKVICVRRALRGLLSLPSLSASKGVAFRTLADLATSGSLRPSYVVNGVPMYHPAALSSYSHLLRPANAPDADALLRPSDESGPALPDTLLRAANTEAPDV